MMVGRRRGSAFYGLGLITQAQIDSAQARLGAVDDDLLAKNDLIRAAQRTGFDARTVERLYTEHDALEDNALSVATAIGAASTDDQWLAALAALASVERQVSAWDPTTTLGGSHRTAIMVAATLGSVALAATLAWGLFTLSHRKRRA
jgi:hypothetical protein